MEDELLVLAEFAAKVLGIEVEDLRKISGKEKTAETELGKKWDGVAGDMRKTAEKEIYGTLNRHMKAEFGDEVQSISRLGQIKPVLVSIKEMKAASGDGGLTDDQVKGHSVYLNMLKEKDDAYNKLKSDNEKALTDRDVTSMALKYRGDKKAIIPEDQDLAKSKEEIFLQRLLQRGYTFEAMPDNSGYWVKEGDQYKLNKNNHKLTLEELSESELKVIYGIQTVDPKQNANPQGNPPSPAGPTGGGNGFNFEKFKGAIPKTITDYYGIINDYNVPADQKGEVKEYWKTSPDNPEKETV
jgi:hypothetical protein